MSSSQSIGAPLSPPSQSPDLGSVVLAGITDADLEALADLRITDVTRHRQVFHPRPVHGCPKCPPAPCKCGFDAGVCPDVGEHYRQWASSELAWREMSAR